MKHKYFCLLGGTLSLLALVFTACQPEQQVEQPVVEEPMVASTEVMPAEPARPVIRIGILQLTAETSLERLWAVAYEASDAVGADIELVPIYAGGDTGMPLMADGDMRCLMFNTMPPGLDVYMLQGMFALSTYDQIMPLPVDDALMAEYLSGVGEPALRTFRRGEELLGVPLAVAPLMTIYNPEMFIDSEHPDDIPDPLAMDAFTELVERQPMAVTPHGGMAVAVMQSAIGPVFSEETVMTELLQGQMQGYLPTLQTLIDNGWLTADSSTSLLERFSGYNLAWTIGTPAFLNSLAQMGYAGGVDIRPLPSFGMMQGSAAMGVGFSVSNQTADPYLAWTVVSYFTNHPQTSLWMLENGWLPASSSGFDQLRAMNVDGKLRGQLPDGYLGADPELLRLERMAHNSVVWRFPEGSPIDRYDLELLPRTEILMTGLLNGQIRLNDGFAEWFGLLSEGGMLMEP